MLFVLLVVFVMVMIIVVIVITILTLVTVAGFGADGRTTRPADPGADQLTGIAADTLADGGTAQRSHSASGKFSMVYRRKDGNIGWVEPKAEN